ncbi:MAG: glycosyltransferase family 4 protein, partial [Methanomassiliicoccales archaeon]|nr:glycosyltransferase family 4 protein [Methanomassiliicoccales archaeon]
NIVELGKRMVSEGNEVTIFVSDCYLPQHRASLPDGLIIEYLATRTKFLFPPAYAPFTPSLRRRLNESKFDVIQAEEIFQTGTTLGWLASGGNTPFFVWQELDIIMRGAAGRMQRMFYSTLGRRMAERSAAIIPRSQSASNHLKEFGLGERTEQVVHSGVDTEVFKPVQREVCRSVLALSQYDNVILGVGRLHPSKGFDTAIEAFAPIAKSTNACLVIKGQGPQLDELRRLAVQLGVEERVRFIDKYLERVAMVQLYNSADALLVSSRNDLFPFSAIEAISCGLPVLTSFKRGLRTDIVDQGAGLLLPEAASEMTAGISEAFSDRGRLANMGRRGRELALEEFDFKVMAERLLSIYRRQGG